jgi:Protein of unknown function (DUF433)
MSSLTSADLHRPVDALASDNGLEVVERSPDVLGGTALFRGTRVQVRVRLDYLADGDTLETFLLISHPIRRQRAIAQLELMPS